MNAWWRLSVEIPFDSTSVTPHFHLGAAGHGRAGRATEPDPSQLIAHNAETAKLKARDAQIRAHEQAHVAAAGGLATAGPKFTFQRDPDGKLYVVGGEVNSETSPVPGDAEATIRKAQTIREAALAPANPSAQDRAVAASTTPMEAAARRELQHEQTERLQGVPATSTLFPPQFIDLLV